MTEPLFYDPEPPVELSQTGEWTYRELKLLSELIVGPLEERLEAIEQRLDALENP